MIKALNALVVVSQSRERSLQRPVVAANALMSANATLATAANVKMAQNVHQKETFVTLHAVLSHAVK